MSTPTELIGCPFCDGNITDVVNEAAAALSAASPFMGAVGVRNLVRPIVGIENRTAQEAFDIMSDRIRSALIPAPVPQEAAGSLADPIPVRQGATGEPVTDADLLASLGTDAAKWAEAFCAAYFRLDHFVIDPAPGDNLHAWFCNMIEAGRSAGYSEATRDANTLSHRAALAAGRAEAVAAGWQTMDTAPEVGSKFIALYNDGSGAVMFYRHDDGYIDHEGADRTSVDFSKFGKWAYLPAGFELWCEMGVEPIELPEWKGPGSALVSAPAAPIDGTGRFKPCITVNEEAGITEATFEDVAYVAQPVFPGIPHWIDKHVAMDDGRLVGIAIWATKPPAAPAAEAEPGSSFWGAPEHERGRMLSRIRELETALTAPSASHEALREALRVMKDTYANCAGLTEADKRAHALADAALAQSAPVKAGG